MENGSPSDGKCWWLSSKGFCSNRTRPLPRGEVRDMPNDAKIHRSAIRRMENNPNYRPGNLICGGGGRGYIKAPKEAGIGEWIVVGEEGDVVGERVTMIRKLKEPAQEKESRKGTEKESS